MKCKNCNHDVTRVNKHGEERLFMCIQEDCTCLEPEVDCKHLDVFYQSAVSKVNKTKDGFKIDFNFKEDNKDYLALDFNENGELEEIDAGKTISIDGIRFCPFCGDELK